jgi:CspA family cold shock protein
MMLEGTIKKIVSDRGFGFIGGKAGRNGDVFFHASAVENKGFDTLKEGDKVQYELDKNSGKDGRGPRASYIQQV